MILGAGALAVLVGCTGGVTQPDDTDTETETPGDPTPAPRLVYPGQGFIVHEWGTDTVVVGSDGSLQRGLHHEEEDLPDFVYDRIKAGSLEGTDNVHVKMETPVTYFYSDAPRTVDVSVAFPAGVLTQWYPAVADFYPFVAAPKSVAGLETMADPALDMHFPFASQTCADNHGKVGNGLLAWGKVELLGRDAGADLPAAPIEKYTWSHARDVKANLVRVSGVPGATTAAQHERFLFYRGVGNFDLPVIVKNNEKGSITATNTLDEPIGTVFVLHVQEKWGAFRTFEQGISASATLSTTIPSLGGDDVQPIGTFVDSLGEAVTDALDRAGLYHDEAVAMVNTWKRQWFRTPGIRVLYLAPQSWTDASIPLSIEPKPDATLRVMMMRVELITPEEESTDAAIASQLSNPAKKADVTSHFLSLGRFAEPRMRRALAILGDPPGSEALLAEVASSKTAVSAGE